MGTEGNGVDYGPVIADLETKIAEMQNTLAGLKRAAGIVVDSSSISVTASPSAISATIRFDSFLRMTVFDALMAFLKMHYRNPQTTKQILEALNKGGLRTTYSTVSSILSRRASEDKDIMKVGKSTWGLKEWYPGSARKRKSKNASEQQQEEIEEIKE